MCSLLGPELLCLVKVEEDLFLVLIFQHVILSIALIDAVLVVKDLDINVIYRNNETILILISLKRYFSHPEKSILNLSLP